MCHNCGVDLCGLQTSHARPAINQLLWWLLVALTQPGYVVFYDVTTSKHAFELLGEITQYSKLISEYD